MKSATPARRGRPSKFGRASQVVALTLPEEVVTGLRKVHDDVGWAIVTLFEKSPAGASTRTEHPDVELVTVGERRSLIVVNRDVFTSLPGVSVIPLHGNRAFLALETGSGMSGLELAVIDRLDAASIDVRERKALQQLRAQLRSWRHDRSLRFHTRSIIVVERLPARARAAKESASRT